MMSKSQDNERNDNSLPFGFCKFCICSDEFNAGVFQLVAPPLPKLLKISFMPSCPSSHALAAIRLPEDLAAWSVIVVFNEPGHDITAPEIFRTQNLSSHH